MRLSVLRSGPICGLLGVVVLLGACGGSGGGPPSISADEANRQYRQEAARWELPPGWSWPDRPYSGKGPDGAGASYGVNMGRVDATLYWQCAWSRTLLTAKSERDRRKALDQVLRTPNTAFYRVSLDSAGVQTVDEALDAAKAGDFSKLARDTELNCPEKEPQ